MAQFSLSPGDPAPWFSARARSNPIYHLDTAAGMYMVLSFYGSAGQPYAKALLDEVTGPLRHYFDDTKCAFFGISTDPADEKENRLPHLLPGVRHFYDHDLNVSEKYGVVGNEDGRRQYRPVTVVLDPLMRVLAVIPIDDGAAHNRKLAALLGRLPPVDEHAGVPIHAPVLIVPRVFEPEFCRELIQLYNDHGG